MAKIFPNNPVGVVAPEILKIFRLLKRLPDQYAVWMRLSVEHGNGPHFWVLHNDGRMLLISVAAASARDVRQAGQAALFEPKQMPGDAEMQAAQQFQQQLIGERITTEHVPVVIVFPNVPAADLAQALPAHLPGIQWAGQADISIERFGVWLESRLGVALTPTERLQVRRIFTPEVVVPAAITVRGSLDRGTAANVTGYLLSYNQEWVLKHDLDLSAEGEIASDNLQVRLVNGVAGSGKSLILLYRARLLRQFFPHKRILALTHNRPLINDLKRRYLQISNGDRAIEWCTFHGWCHKYWPEDEPRAVLVRSRERLALVRQVWHTHLAGTSISPEMLQDEIDWLKDRLITTREGYSNADRSGRGFRLAESMRERAFAAIRAYQDLLQQRNLLDYGDVPRRIWRGMLEERVAHPAYDFILIDEAQFFAPIWFEILKQTLTKNGHLFLVADPTQGFLKRRQSWAASGLEVRGHTQRLETCYRTTPSIMQFAARYYQSRLPDDDEALIAATMQHTDPGLPPQLVQVASEQDELTRVVNELRNLTKAGIPLGHILVLHADWQGAERLRERLREEFGEAQAINPRHEARTDVVRVCTLDAATGLESPIVFLVGTHRLHELEASPRLSNEERAERMRDNTRRLYMAMTRAGQRLVLTYVGAVPEALQQAACPASHS